jgi:hypothetical protein
MHVDIKILLIFCFLQLIYSQERFDNCFFDETTDFILRWNITANGNLTMRVYLPLAGNGWGAIGLNEKGKGMPGAYIIMGFQNEINEYEATDYSQPKLLNKQYLFDKQSFTRYTDGKPAYRNPTTALWMYFSRPVKVENDSYFEIKNETQNLFIAFNDYQIPESNTSFMKHTIVYVHEINLFQPSL